MPIQAPDGGRVHTLSVPNEHEIVLVNFGKMSHDWTTRTGSAWGKSKGLHPEDLRLVYAICANKPQLYRELCVEVLLILSPVPFWIDGPLVREERAPVMLMKDREQRIAHYSFDAGLGEYDWLAFFRG